MLKVFKTRYILLAAIIIFLSFKTLRVDWIFSTRDISRTLNIIDCYAVLMILPLMYDILYSMVSYSKPRRKLLWNYAPAAGVGTLILVLCIASDFNHDIAIYKFNAFILNATLYLQLLCFAVVMSMKFYRYHQKIFNYYVDINDTDYPHTRNVCVCFTFIVLIIYCEIIFRSMSPLYDIATFFIYLSITVIVLAYIGYNLRQITGETIIKRLSTKAYSADEVIEMAKQANPDTITKLYREIVSSIDIDDETNEQNTIEDIVNQWISRSDKPYLRESITLNAVADDMNVNSRTLSLYLNSVLNQNFNSWINSLRIEEAKRLIENDITISMVTVAVKCGFADTAMLSKKFKKFAGCTPSEYKREYAGRGHEE